MNASYQAQMQEDQRIMRQNEQKMAQAAAAVPGGVRHPGTPGYKAPLERATSSQYGPAGDHYDEERSFKSNNVDS